ncbi:MAG TPA: exodeoxyribonuclease V subunit gamma, partial [Vulgatibacter sp.]
MLLPMIRLTYSNRSEKLLDALAADLSAAGRDPFEPARLVVPNRNVEAWIRHGLARRLGIAANLEVQQLRRFVGGLLRDAVPGTRLVDGELLLDLVLSCLLDEERMSRPGLERLRSYLRAGGDRPEAVDLRRYQLASELARLFDEYCHSRPEMIGAWPREAALIGTAQEEIEAWQRRLWLEIFGRGGLAEERARESGEQWWHLPQLLDRIGEVELRPGGPVRLVGISYVASAFHRIFGRLARDAELDVYALNPCMEFWEDVEASHEARARLSKRIRLGRERLGESDDPFGLTTGGDTPALSLWGKPGRENVRLLNELADCDFHAVFEDFTDERPSLLRQLQQDILVRHPER